MVQWYEAGILSHQPRFDSCPGKKPQKIIQKPPGLPLMTVSHKEYLKNFEVKGLIRPAVSNKILPIL